MEARYLTCSPSGIPRFEPNLLNTVRIVLITKTWHGPHGMSTLLKQIETLWTLLLETTDGSAKQYKHIGTACICPGNSMVQGWTKREIRIISLMIKCQVCVVVEAALKAE